MLLPQHLKVVAGILCRRHVEVDTEGLAGTRRGREVGQLGVSVVTFELEE
jgi:hypothetical protein